MLDKNNISEEVLVLRYRGEFLEESRSPRYCTIAGHRPDRG